MPFWENSQAKNAVSRPKSRDVVSDFSNGVKPSLTAPDWPKRTSAHLLPFTEILSPLAIRDRFLHRSRYVMVNGVASSVQLSGLAGSLPAVQIFLREGRDSLLGSQFPDQLFSCPLKFSGLCRLGTGS